MESHNRLGCTLLDDGAGTTMMTPKGEDNNGGAGGSTTITTASTGDKRSFADASIDSPSNSGDSTLRPENRSLPHKKRRPAGSTGAAANDQQELQASKGQFNKSPAGGGTGGGEIRTITVSSAPQQQQQQQQKPPTTIKSPSSAASIRSNKNNAQAWMHRLYPFDGPSIEEVTALFKYVDIEQLVQDKLNKLKDRLLADMIKTYYDKVIQMDHLQYKEAERPPHGTPDDIRPFLLSRHQLKSFNSDYLRSALRKTKVNKSFCTLLRSSMRVIGVPVELQQLGNEAFARSIRTHQIIAFFMRYYSLYTTKFPGQILNLNDQEHRILLDCLKDIMRRVTAKKVIQRSVVEHEANNHGGGVRVQQPGAFPTPVTATSNQATTPGGAMALHHHHPSYVGGNPSFFSMDTDEKENKSGDAVYAAGTSSAGAGAMDLSFDSTTTNTTTTTTTSSSSLTSPGSFHPYTTGHGGGESSTASYNDVLALLSTDARQAVEAMVEKLKQKVQEDARQQICKRSFEQGRNVGRMEGQRLIMYLEGANDNNKSTPPPAGVMEDNVVRRTENEGG